MLSPFEVVFNKQVDEHVYMIYYLKSKRCKICCNEKTRITYISPSIGIIINVIKWIDQYGNEISLILLHLTDLSTRV